MPALHAPFEMASASNILFFSTGVLENELRHWHRSTLKDTINGRFQGLTELVGNFSIDNNSLVRHTDLSCIQEYAKCALKRSLLDVCVFAYNSWCFSSELHHSRFQVFAGKRCNYRADYCRAGKIYFSHCWMRDQCCCDMRRVLRSVI
jgi:hypothetical protein